MLEKKPFHLTPKVLLAVISIGLINSIVFTIPYIKYTFYDGMLELTGCTDTQLGLLLTIYGLGEVFSLPIGGILVEKFDVKKVLLISTLITGLLCFLIVLFPSYLTTCIVWFGLIFTSLFMFWGAIFKGLRILAPDEYQGRMNGFYSGASGVGYFVIGLTMVPVYDYFAKRSDGMGMRGVFVFLGILCFVIAIFCYFAVKAAEEEQKANGWTFSEDGQAEQIGGLKGLWEGYKAVMKYKAVWVFGVCLFCVYGIEICISYTTSYFTDVLGITVTFGAVLSVFRSYGMKIIGAPLGGIIADRIGSPAKVTFAGNCVALACLIAIVLMPDAALTLPVLMAIILLTAWFNSMCYGVQFAIPPEAKVPASMGAAAIGLGSAIGYIPDVYQHAMIGSWLDKWGNAAYKPTFIFGIGLAVVANVVLLYFLKCKKTGKLVIGEK